MPLLLDVLDTIETLSTSSSTLQDHILLNLTVSDFPMLSYVNEPMSHFLNSEVIKVLREQTREVNKLVKIFFGLCLILSGLGNIVVDFHF